MEKKFNLKYKGVAPIALVAKGFRGVVKKGDIVSVFKISFDEMKGHDNWTVVKELKGVK
tara:strand:- start:1441 stop:1617 length:177 start_codon:yes stop_codon:yes gene_type:complete